MTCLIADCTGDGSTPAPTYGTLILDQTDAAPDFMLAATYQMAPADPRVTATDYCDAHATTLTADSMVSLSTGFDAFTGKTKCTYFLTTAAASGLAPAWRLVSSLETATTNFWDYDLVIAEYFDLDLAASTAAGAPYAAVTGIPKVPEVTNALQAATFMDYEAAAALGMGVPPMYHNCDFETTYGPEQTGGYGDISMSMSCLEVE